MADQVFKIVRSTDRAALERLIGSPGARDRAVERRVSTIVAAVRRRGDEALLRYARRIDRLDGPIELSAGEISDGARQTPREVREAIRLAARHIRKVARQQLPPARRVRVADGVEVEQRVRPLDRVGCYVPGGRYPLPSSLLMTVVPANAAGVEEIVVTCPRPTPAVLAAAVEAGVTRLFRVGGAQAIAALAYGTETVPRVDKIVGPGNAYVAAAKALVSRDCAIDFFAGPTEIVIVTAGGNPRWVAADLIAQAEHDPDARALLITPNHAFARGVQREVERALTDEGPARAALAQHGGAVLTRDLAEAVALADELAPEHVVVDDDRMADGIGRAGAIFVGEHSAQASGDYATGSNHVLPTNGAARHRGGLSAADFVRVSTVQRISQAGLRRIGPAVITLAEAEGLSGHAQSIRVRLDDQDPPRGARTPRRPAPSTASPKRRSRP